MTYADFKDKITSKYRWEKYLNYCISLFAIVGALYLYVYFLKDPPLTGLRHNYLLLFPIVPLFLGSLSIYLIPRRYQITSVDSRLNIDEKEKIVARLKANLKLKLDSDDNGWYLFYYQKHFWTMDYSVLLTHDSVGFYFIVQAGTQYRRGIIDLGGSKKLRNKIEKEILSLSDQ